MAIPTGDPVPKITPWPTLAPRDLAGAKTIADKEASEPIVDYPPTTRIEEPVNINSGPPVGLAVLATSQSANLPRMLSKANATWENGSSAHRTSSEPTLALPSQIAAAPTPCGSRQSQKRQPQQQQQEPLQQKGQGREGGPNTHPVQAESGKGSSISVRQAGPSITVRQAVRPSVCTSNRTFISCSSFPATGDPQPPVPSKVVGVCRPNTATNPMVQTQYLSKALPAGLPWQGSWQKIAPEGLKAEPRSNFVTPLPSLVTALFPPMEFQFHKTVAAPVTDSIAGDDMIGLRSVGEVISTPQCQDGCQNLDKQQVQEDQGQQLEHIRSLALDLTSTVQQLCEMQKKLGHELQEVKLQVNHNSENIEEFRSSFEQTRGSQRSGARPSWLASAPHHSHHEAQFPVHQQTNSMVSSPQLDLRAHTPQDLHQEIPIPTPMSQQSTSSAARNLGYTDTQDLLHTVHGRALEGLGSLQDWTARAMHNLVAGDTTGSPLCCQTGERQPSRPLTRI